MPPAQATRAEQLATRGTLLLQHFKQVGVILIAEPHVANLSQEPS